MFPGNPQILTCPYCGTEKAILSLLSGNTFGAELWSDNKCIYPMLPEISLIQKCPNCGKYYNRTKQEERYSDGPSTFECGTLSYPEMKEAFNQLLAEGFADDKEESSIRLMLHHVYNDYYFRSGDDKTIPEEDKSIFRTNALWLIENVIKDNVLKAEYYREVGDFETAQSLIESYKTDDDFIKSIIEGVKERIANKDSRVFRVELPKKQNTTNENHR